MADQPEDRSEAEELPAVPEVAPADLDFFENIDWTLILDAPISEIAHANDPSWNLFSRNWSSPGSWDLTSLPHESRAASLLVPGQRSGSITSGGSIVLTPASPSSVALVSQSPDLESGRGSKRETPVDLQPVTTTSSSASNSTSTNALHDVGLLLQNTGDWGREPRANPVASESTSSGLSPSSAPSLYHSGALESSAVLRQRPSVTPIQPKPPDLHQPRQLNNSSGTSADVAQRGPLSAPAVLTPRLKRSSMSEAGRQKVKRVRQAGACIRCRMYNESCDENTPCARCIAVAATSKIFTLPCYRERLDDILAFRAGNSRAGKVRSDSPKFRWSSDDCGVKSIDLCYAFKNVLLQSESTVSVKCRNFIPQPWDVLEEPWPAHDGLIVTLRSTPYACYDVDETIKALGEYISRYKFALLEESMNDIKDDLQKCTHQEALRYATFYPDSAVATALNIQAGCYFSRTRMVMSGENSLGLDYFDDPRVRSNGKTPIPAVLDYQIDFMAIQYMLKQMAMVVKRLKPAIFGKARNRNWYEVYLTSFLLLSSLEIAQSRQVEIMKRWEIPGNNVTSQVRSTSDRMMQEWSHSAKVIIYHYRAILKGMVPFTLDSATSIEELKNSAGLDNEAMSYISKIKEMIRKTRGQKQTTNTCDLDNKDGKPFTWLSLLYLDRIDLEC